MAHVTEDRPDQPNEAVKRQAHDLRLVRDVSSGTTVMRNAGTRYLPQASGEELADYENRLQRSEFHNVFERTVTGLTGLVFANDPEIGRAHV